MNAYVATEDSTTGKVGPKPDNIWLSRNARRKLKFRECVEKNESNCDAKIASTSKCRTREVPQISQFTLVPTTLLRQTNTAPR